MQRVFIVILIAAIPVILFLFMSERGHIPFLSFLGDETADIEIGTTPMRVDVFDTESERALGLSGRSELAPHTGALFIFDETGYHGMWMKDMLISIDIMWIDEDREIVHIEENIHPNTFPTTFEPDRPARFVIETSSRYVSSFGIEVGDFVRIPERFMPEDLRD